MSDINIDFTISSVNANLEINPAPTANFTVANSIVANLFIEGTTGSSGTVTQVLANGNGLGFSLDGNIVSSGNITLTVPNANTLRTNLNIGNVANINLNNNPVTFLNGNGGFSSLSVNSINGLLIASETVNISAIVSGTQNFDLLDNPIVYSNANATGNITLNFRGNSTTTLANTISVGQSVTCAYLMTTTTTGYIPTVIQIDGSTQTVRYAANSAPVPIGNTICSYTYTIIKTSVTPTYVVLGSQTRYG